MDDKGLSCTTDPLAKPLRLVGFPVTRLTFSADKPVARVVPAGSRLRFVVTGADPRQRNLAQIRQTPPPQITVHLGGAQGSRIELPVEEK